MSTLKADTIQNTSGGAATLTKQQAAKAHIYSPTQSGSIFDSLNVSSIDDDGTGQQGVNYTSSFSDANYTSVASMQTTVLHNTGASIRVAGVYQKTSSGADFRSDYATSSALYNGGYEEAEMRYNMSAHGDLA